MNASHAFFEHTADVGIRADGRTLAELFVQMARGVVELIAEDSALTPQEERAVSLTAEDAPSLLISWLNELLFWFSADRFLPVAYDGLEVTGTTVRGCLRGERFDPARHVQGREVKAVTRHALKVEARGGMWHGEVIVDI